MRWLIWMTLATAVAMPALLSLASPLLAYRQPVYIIAGLAGVLGLSVLLVQPSLVSGRMPISPITARRCHRLTGLALFILVIVHVIGLWITSPPDVIDALLFRSPTTFSIWGVIAMWAVFFAAVGVTLRRRLSPRLWRWGHRALAILIVGGTIAHALLIDGTMEPYSKFAICGLVALATLTAMVSRTPWRAGRG